jgi:pSer/pThr/pTyr-binding forkhead associated (FHA) protein
MLNSKIFFGHELSTDDPVFLLSSKQPHMPDLQGSLTVVRGAQNGAVFYLDNEVNLFGRTEGRFIRDVLASRRHMHILKIGQNFILEDLQSTNGTCINGKPVIESVVLNHGDMIRIGETLMVFEILGRESAVIGYGAVPQRMADHSKIESTQQTRALNISIHQSISHKGDRENSNPAKC